MRKFIFAVFFILPLILTEVVFAKDVHVKGYYRKDGTYVKPHVRSQPDQYKWNNYGPAKTPSEKNDPKSRDNDQDGIPNYLDQDDDNDGYLDDYDTNQYRKN